MNIKVKLQADLEPAPGNLGSEEGDESENSNDSSGGESGDASENSEGSAHDDGGDAGTKAAA